MSQYYTYVVISFKGTETETTMFKKLLKLMDKEKAVSIDNQGPNYIFRGIYENALLGELEDLGEDAWGARYAPDCELKWAPKLIAALFPSSSFTIHSQWENSAGGGTGVLEGKYENNKLIIQECQTDDDIDLLTEEEGEAYGEGELEQDDIIRILLQRKGEFEIQPEINPTYIKSFFNGEDLLGYLKG